MAAASPFIGQGENALLVRPFVKDMTRSEIHQIMTSGFATISGTNFIILSSLSALASFPSLVSFSFTSCFFAFRFRF